MKNQGKSPLTKKGSEEDEVAIMLNNGVNNYISDRIEKTLQKYTNKRDVFTSKNSNSSGPLGNRNGQTRNGWSTNLN